LIGVIALAVIAGSLSLIFFHRHQPPAKVQIPDNISRQYDFTPLIVKETQPSQVAAESKTFKYDKQDKVLSFVIDVQNKQVTVTEQAYPDALIFDKVISSFNVYNSFDSKTGKVYLGHPSPSAAPGASQAAVTRTDSLLIFAKPDQSLTDEQWQQLFGSLSVP
jgi:hypothetical protein